MDILKIYKKKKEIYKVYKYNKQKNIKTKTN